MHIHYGSLFPIVNTMGLWLEFPTEKLFSMKSDTWIQKFIMKMHSISADFKSHGILFLEYHQIMNFDTFLLLLFTWVCEPKMKFETDFDEFFGAKLIMGQLCNSFKHLPKVSE